MSVRSEKHTPAATAAESMAAAISDAQPEGAELAEGSSFATAAAENPLRRNVVVSVRATLNDLCLQKQKGTWAPSADALRQIFQQKVRACCCLLLAGRRARLPRSNALVSVHCLVEIHLAGRQRGRSG